MLPSMITKTSLSLSMKTSTSISEIEGEDGSKQMSQVHHDRHLHLASPQDQIARNPPRQTSAVDLATP